MMKMCGVHKVAWVLVIIGGLNWGLNGIFQWDLVMALLGSWPMLVRVVYTLVGASAALMLLAPSCKPCKDCAAQK